MGRDGHTSCSAEGGNSRILLTEARDGLSDRKEEEAASKQKETCLKQRELERGRGRARREDLLGGTARPTCCVRNPPASPGPGRDECSMMEDREGVRDASFSLSATDWALQVSSPGWRPCWDVPKANIMKAAGPQEKTARV